MIKTVQRFGRIATFALSFLISLVIVRLYGTEVMGNYTYLMTIITFLILLVSFGTNQTILSSFEKSNIAGTQYHPELSQKNGLSVLRNFVKLF